MKVHHCDVKTK